MDSLGFAYQRPIVGFHGCDRTTAERVILQDARLLPSSNPYDWLGAGIYFWEHAPERALDYAREKQRRTPHRIKNPYVLGAYIQLGRCLDLTDIAATSQLRSFFPTCKRIFRQAGLELPKNKKAEVGDRDLLFRFRDCAVLNAFLKATDARFGHGEPFYQTVRGVFVEGKPAFPGSRIAEKTHVQVAVRDQRCILGYFKPAL